MPTAVWAAMAASGNQMSGHRRARLSQTPMARTMVKAAPITIAPRGIGAMSPMNRIPPRADERVEHDPDLVPD